MRRVAFHAASFTGLGCKAGADPSENAP
jgi:hypothetical protein